MVVANKYFIVYIVIDIYLVCKIYSATISHSLLLEKLVVVSFLSIPSTVGSFVSTF